MSWNYKLIALGLGFGTACMAVASVPTVDTLRCTFVREVVSEGRSERVNGTLYWDGGIRRAVLVVDDPIKQWLVVSSSDTLIYYPEDAKAFRFTHRPTALAPFSALLGGLDNPAAGLAKLGFRLARKDASHDRLSTIWTPPSTAAKRVREAVIELRGDRVVSFALNGRTGQPVVSVAYSRHYRHKGINIPLEVLTKRHSGGRTSQERVSLSNPTFDQPLPTAVKQFQLPPTVRIEEMDW